MAHVAVRGVAKREVLPERATARLSVQVSGSDSATVLADAQRVHAAIVEQATGLVADGVASDWTARQVQSFSYVDWVPLTDGSGRQEQVRRFRATGDVDIEFRDLDEVGRWLAKVGELSGVEVRGVDWSLTDATAQDIGSQVRAEAVRNAVARAMDYSTALGLDELDLEGIYEPGLYPGECCGGGGGIAPMPRVAMLAGGIEAGGAGFELKPAVVPVIAEVAVVFKTARA